MKQRQQSSPQVVCRRCRW